MAAVLMALPHSIMAFKIKAKVDLAEEQLSWLISAIFNKIYHKNGQTSLKSRFLTIFKPFYGSLFNLIF